MSAKYEYDTQVVKNQNELTGVMNQKANEGWRVSNVCPIEGRSTWDILITFEKEINH